MLSSAKGPVTTFQRFRVRFAVLDWCVSGCVTGAEKVLFWWVCSAPWVCVVTPNTPAAIGSLQALLSLQFFG